MTVKVNHCGGNSIYWFTSFGDTGKLSCNCWKKIKRGI